MAGWIAENHDYLYFVTTSLAVFGLLEGWLRMRRPRGKLPFAVWPAVVILLGAGWFLVDGAGHAESRRIQSFLEGVAPTYAQEIERMGHSAITLDTRPDDPRYLAMIDEMKRWKAVNPTISDVYTFRLIDGRVRLMVDSETDYNHDGKISGWREERIPIGREYTEADPGMFAALAGKSSFSDMPVRDEWGVWVSAQVPLRDASGRVEAALGVDYPAEQWVEAIALGRQRMLWLLAIPVLMLGFGGAITGVLKAEIAARALVEERLRGSEARLRTAMDSLPFGFWVMDDSRRCVLSNATAKKLWGDNTGKTVAETGLPPDTVARWEEDNRRVFAGETIRRQTAFEVNGQLRHFYDIVSPVRVGDAIVGTLGINLDLTERIEAEQAQQKSEHRLALHVRQTPLAVVEWDLDFRVTGWNPAAERIFGYTAAEAIGRRADELLLADGETRAGVMAAWRSILSRRDGARGTHRNVTKAGKSILCEWYSTPLVDDGGQVIGVASHCQDITGREELEKQVRQAQKIESLGQLAAGVAHEFNNLLTPMLLRLEMLRADRAGDAALLESLRSLKDAIEQAAQLSQRILSVGQRSSGKREMLLLNPIVDDTVGLLRHTLDRRIALSLRLSPGLGPLSLDRAHVAQIVVNLAINARDALMQKLEEGAPEGWTPRIEISTTRAESAPAAPGISAAPFARSCQCFTVSDNGAGMSLEVRARAFEPFYTTKAPGKGTGLGLAVVWNVVKSLDGWVELESRPGHGTVFRVYFPVPDAPAAEADGAGLSGGKARTGDAGADGRRILLVEDNVFVAETISSLLTRAGHAVTYAQNGEEAWELFRLRELDFDLVLTDENMPVLGGLGLLRRLREAGHAIRVIVVSGHLGAEKLAELKRLGVHGILQKPFPPKELLALLK